MNEYYEQFIILKLKKDIYETLSSQCLDERQLENVINDHFQNYKVTMDVEKRNLKKYIDQEKI